jgi:hypothetical protein
MCLIRKHQIQGVRSHENQGVPTVNVGMTVFMTRVTQ